MQRVPSIFFANRLHVGIIKMSAYISSFITEREGDY